MEIIYRKADSFSPFRHGTFQLNSQELKNDYHSIHFDLQQDDNQIKLYVNSQLIEDDNYHLHLKGASLILLISEKTEIEKPLYVHHLNRSALEKNQNEQLRSCEYILPGDNYKIKRTIWNKDKNRLEIILCKSFKKYDLKNNHKIYRRKRS
ncbi:hypothetical protein N9164_00435 [Draconibacterium sp.]|nr:hypothetical protein [Draconibacterium sp.]